MEESYKSSFYQCHCIYRATVAASMYKWWIHLQSPTAVVARPVTTASTSTTTTASTSTTTTPSTIPQRTTNTQTSSMRRTVTPSDKIHGKYVMPTEVRDDDTGLWEKLKDTLRNNTAIKEDKHISQGEWAQDPVAFVSSTASPKPKGN